MRDRLPGARPPPAAGSYAALLRDRVFLRYALSQACALGGLLSNRVKVGTAVPYRGQEVPMAG